MSLDFAFLIHYVFEFFQKQHVYFGHGEDLLQLFSAADQLRDGEQPVVPALRNVGEYFFRGYFIELGMIDVAHAHFEGAHRF